ncbi:AI-2E family transporter [Fibrobacterota bacterium]
MAKHGISKTDTFQKTSFLMVLLVIFLLFLYMIRGFVMPVLIGAIFTGLTYPVYEKVHKLTRNRFSASILSLCLLLLVIILPVFGVGYLAYREASAIISAMEISAMQSKLEGLFMGILADPPWFLRGIIEALPLDVESLDYSQLAGEAMGSLKKVVQYLFSGGASLSRSFFGALATAALTLFIMFYFYLDGQVLLKRLIHLSPLNDEYERRIIERFVSVTRATLKGTMLIGVVQGALGGLVIWAVGIPSPVFWALLMTILSIIPGVGVVVVLLPAALFLFFKGALISGIVVLVACVVIGVMDNFLRPVLVGKDLKMHDLLILFSTLGGIGMFGLIGFIIGPIIASLFVTVLQIYEEVYKKELDRNVGRQRSES